MRVEGLNTPMPYGDRTLDIEFDFIEHRLIAQPGMGGCSNASAGGAVSSDFYRSTSRASIDGNRSEALARAK